MTAIDAGRDSGVTDAGRDSGTDAGRDSGVLDARADTPCTMSEGLCANGRDDDCDGDVDCLDLDCELRPICDPTCGGTPCP